VGAVSSYPTDTPDATDYLLGTNAAGDVKRFLMGLLQNVGRTVYKLTADHVNSTTTSTTITDGTTPWSHPVVAGKTYKFSMMGLHQTVVGTTGMRLSVLNEGGVDGQPVGRFWATLTNGVGGNSFEGTLSTFATSTTVWPTGSSILTTAVAPANQPHHNGLEFVLHCTANGSVSIQFASEIAASAAQMNAGSTLIVEELS